MRDNIVTIFGSRTADALVALDGGSVEGVSVHGCVSVRLCKEEEKDGMGSLGSRCESAGTSRGLPPHLAAPPATGSTSS
jgi:hypothetical protein